MAITISVRFITGRAHLHHWQAHHSDGKVDWPPSPWRLLRALVAVAGRGLTTLPAPDDTPPTPNAPITGLASIRKHGVPKNARGKLSYSKAKKTLSLKEILTDAETAAFKSANPIPEFAAVLDRLREIAAMPVPQAMVDIEHDEISLSRLAALLACLSPAPEIWLQRTSGGHTRQFFPIHEGGMVKNSGSAVFDTFAVVDKHHPILFSWPNVTFDPEDQRRKDLTRILQRMTYFGRAESWCEAQVYTILSNEIKGIVPGETHWRCKCIEDGEKPDGQEHRDYTLERKLVALPLENEKPGGLASEVSELLPRTAKINPNRPREQGDFAALLAQEPGDELLLRCLLRESGQDMKDGLERPIGSRWVHYAVPRAIYNLPRPAPRKRIPRLETVHVVRYTLNTASVHRPVLSPLTDTLLVADKFRSAAMALHKSPSSKLSGHKGSVHDEHAFYWPTDEDNDGFIDHVTVYCPSGFEITEIDALRRLVRIRSRGGRPDLLVTPVYVGDERNFGPWRSQDQKGNDQNVRVFVSATPYFCPVHLTHGKGGYGRTRSITPQVLKSMKIGNVIAAESEVETVEEIVFDYAPEELAQTVAALLDGKVRQPLAPRQYFSVIDPPAAYPPLPSLRGVGDMRFAGASLKDPGDGFPFGLAVGLTVDQGSRFIRAMSFCKRRRGYEIKSFGRMFRIQFRALRRPKPFAIGDQCHFGLGLFVPASDAQT